MPEILPVHNGNNHWRNLIFKDNGVESQSSFYQPILNQKRFSSLLMLVVTDPHHLPSSYITSNIPKARYGRCEVDGEKQKQGLHLIIRDSQKGKTTINNKNTHYCVVFLSTTSYTRGGYISRMVEKEQSPVCDISLQSKFRDCPEGEGSEEMSNSCPIMRTVNTPVLW